MTKGSTPHSDKEGGNVIRYINERNQLKVTIILGIMFMFVVGVAQWLRRQVVALEIVGSNPTAHPF